MSISDKSIKEFQELYEKEYGKKISWEEAAESARNLVGLFDLLLKHSYEDEKRKEKLKEFPDGFHIEGVGYNCGVCHDTISNNETWYNKFGLTCVPCYKALKKKIIPASVIKNRDSWYADWEFKHYWDMHPSTLKKLVRQGKLKARIIPKDSGWPFYVFIIKDNKGILPEKPKNKHIPVDEKTFRIEYGKAEPLNIE